MPLALFDLDDTLLAGDSNQLWGEFLAQAGLLDLTHFQHELQRYANEYQAGVLDIHDYTRFMLEPILGLSRAELSHYQTMFVQQAVPPALRQSVVARLRWHQQQQHTVVLISATNRVITGPIAAYLGITHLLSTEPEQLAERYTGRVVGVPCYRQGKVQRLQAWLAEQGLSLEHSWGYSDSHNDLPLLTHVAHPIAVHPDAQLAAYAHAHGWPVWCE